MYLSSLISKQDLITKALSTMPTTHKWSKIIAMHDYHEFLQIYIKYCGGNEKRTGKKQRKAKEGLREEKEFKLIKPLP